MKMNQFHPCFKDKVEDNLYKIGMFANMNRVTIKTLRYYDEQKLLEPVYVDNENGYRYYKAGQMAQMQRIIALKNMGFSTEDIRKIINGADEKAIFTKVLITSFINHIQFLLVILRRTDMRYAETSGSPI